MALPDTLAEDAPDALAGSTVLPIDAAAELAGIGDRRIAFAALLPREIDGAVAVFVTDELATALGRRFPGAVRPDPATAEPGTFALVVVDETVCPPGRARSLLRPDGVLVVLGRRGRYVSYPDLHTPQQVWRAGWPVPGGVGAVADARRRTGVVLNRMRGIPRIDVQGEPGQSLAEEVAAEVGVALGDTFTLVGIVTAGHTVLRLRGRREVAVRLSCCEPGNDQLRSELVRADVPEVAHLLPVVLAHGRLGAIPWAATPWLPGRDLPVLGAVRRARTAPRALGDLADGLAQHPTGRIESGWAERWVAASPLVTPPHRAAFVTALSRLEGRAPTGWCHGDPWTGNVVLGSGGPVVIDWDTAVSDAPLGLDRILLAALRRSTTTDVETAEACAALARRPELLDGAVGGRPWSEWDPADRAALVLAAYLLHLRNRAVHDLGEDALARALATMAELVGGDSSRSGPGPGATAATDADPPSVPDAAVETGPATALNAGRGALWFGAGAIATKGYQTIIQLVLAAVLAPAALGVLAVGALITNIVNTVTDMGSSTALVHWRGDPAAPARSALTLGVLTSLLATALGWVAAPWLAGTLGAGPDGVGVIRGLLLTVPLYAVAGVSLELMRRDLAFARRVTPDIASAVVGLGVSLVLVFHGEGVYALVIGQICQAFVRMVACWMLLTPVRPGWSTPHVRALVGYGRHLAGANMLQLIMLNLDYLLVGHFLGAGPLGEYSLAFRLAYMPHVLVTVVICGAAFPYLCRLGSARMGPAVGQLAWLTALIVLPLYVGMALLAPAVVLLGPEWAPAVSVLRWLAVYGVLLSGVQVTLTTFNALGRTRLTFLVNAVHLVALGTLLLVLVHSGITAAGAAQAVAGAVAVALALMLVVRHLPRAAAVARSRDVLVGLAALCALGVAQAVLRPVLPSIAHSAISALVVGVAMALAYLGVLVAGVGPRRALDMARGVMAP